MAGDRVSTETATKQEKTPLLGPKAGNLKQNETKRNISMLCLLLIVLFLIAIVIVLVMIFFLS
jgi:uncharacterized membrane protein YvbJ